MAAHSEHRARGAESKFAYEKFAYVSKEILTYASPQPHGTHSVSTTFASDRHNRASSVKNAPASPYSPAGRMRGRYTIGSAERIAGLFFDFGMVVPPHVMAEVLFL